MGNKTNREGFQVTAVGDILLGARPPDWRDTGFMQLASRINKADLAIGNLECPLVEKGLPVSKVDVARSDCRMGAELRRMGFHALTLANNHIMDYRIQGLRSTQDVLKAQSLKCAGAGANAHQAFSPVYLDVRGRKVALIGCIVFYHPAFESYTDAFRAESDAAGVATIRVHEVRMPGPNGQRGTCVTLAPEERLLSLLLNSIRSARKRVDWVILSVHTHIGDECADEVVDVRRFIMQEAVRAGADLILGHGPHATNGIEYFDGVFIVHSMGNFFFSIPQGLGYFVPEFRDRLAVLVKEEKYWRGLMVQASFLQDRRPVELRLLPCEIVRRGRKEGLPRAASAAAVRSALRRLREMSLPMQVKIEQRADGMLTAKPADGCRLEQGR